MVNLFPQLESLGAWIAAAVYIFSLCVMLVLRFRTGKWKTIKLVHREDGGFGTNPGLVGAGTTDGIG